MRTPVTDEQVRAMRAEHAEALESAAGRIQAAIAEGREATIAVFAKTLATFVEKAMNDTLAVHAEAARQSVARELAEYRDAARYWKRCKIHSATGDLVTARSLLERAVDEILEIGGYDRLLVDEIDEFLLETATVALDAESKLIAEHEKECRENTLPDGAPAGRDARIQASLAEDKCREIDEFVTKSESWSGEDL